MRVLLVNKTKTKEFADFIIQISRIFKIFKNLILMEANLENLIIYKPSLQGHVMSHKKIRPDQFSRFDVYWIQTDRQTDKLNLYIDGAVSHLFNFYKISFIDCKVL